MTSFRLRYHLLLYVSVLTFLLTATIISLYTARFKEHAITGLTEYGKAITVNTSFSLADHLFAEHYAPLQEFVHEFSSRINVEAIEISDEQWNILAATDIEKLGTLMPRDVTTDCVPGRQEDICVRLIADQQQLVVTAPIVIEDLQLGWVRVYLTTAEVMAHVAVIQRQGALTGFSCWFLALTLGFFVMHRLSQPLRKFMQATESISRGDFNVDLPVSRWVWELEKFAEALGVMTSAIASREQDLRRSEKKFRQLFERAMDGIFVADGHGNLLDVNPAMIDILGYEAKKDVLALNFFRDLFFDDENLQLFQGQLAKNGFVQDLEPELKKKDDSKITASLTCHTVRDEQGTITRYEGLVSDITVRKNAEQEIAKMRNFLNNIIESMPSMLVTVDKNSIVTQWNTAAAQQTGIPSTLAIGKKIWDITPFFDKYAKHFDEITRDRQPVKLHREQMLHDEERLYDMTFFPLVANGTSGIAIRLDDITELEKKEQQLRQAQKMESVGTLAGGLAHDFNNVLCGILGNISLMQYKIEQKQPIPEAQLHEYLSRMASSGTRAADLVRQLLTLSRQQEIDLVPVDLNLSIKHVCKIGENTFDKSIEIVNKPAPEPANVLADPTQVEQVILNLCINAVHAMTLMRENDPWGGTLTIGLEKIIIDDLFRKSHAEASADAYWRLTVSDTGVGMESKTVAKIFDPFFTTKEPGKGTGLGLAMAYNIIKQQNGFVNVYTEPGLGSTFNIYLPCLDQGITAAKEAAEVLIVAGQGVILVVDDDEVIRETTRDMLESIGYTVITAPDGRQGVELYRQHQDRIAAVILDMVMPVMSGKEAYMEMKQINEQVKVLLVSGFRQDARVEAVMQLGGNNFLQKPYSLETLAKSLQEVLDKPQA
ncbi:MAG: PAS domain S-box protein [Desulfobulbaceae bacterium]|nr:PAS domain S-box protein [Desulfobulbaceae bacterium]HIJ78559.1 PAS domain S-box protein [Deltaproteobacteria bacterium]